MLDKGSFAEGQKIHTIKMQQVSAQQVAIVQDEQFADFKESIEIAFNPIAMRNRFERLDQRIKKAGKEEETNKTEKGDELDFSIQDIEAISEQFEQKNPELLRQNLVALRSRISKKDTAEEIFTKLTASYPDPSLADEALDFLLATSDPEFSVKLEEVKKRLHGTFEREIRAGKNIMSESQAFAKQNLGTATSLRDLYRDITGNPRDPSILFAELSTKYTFEKMKTVIAFMLRSLGFDLRSKGPSIEPGELRRLMSEVRSMQAILGVYRFFQSRMVIIFSLFDMHDLILPPRITFEALAKLFMKFLIERYPSTEKLFQLGQELGLENELLAKIIIFSQMKDAIRQVSPRLYRSLQHKQDILATFLDALEELEEDLEEQSEEEEKKDQEKQDDQDKAS